MNIVEELRNKKSTYNRRLLDRAADRIDELERTLATMLLETVDFAKKVDPHVKKAIELLTHTEKGGE